MNINLLVLKLCICRGSLTFVALGSSFQHMLSHLGKHRLSRASPCQACPLVTCCIELEHRCEGRRERLLLPSPGHHAAVEGRTLAVFCAQRYILQFGEEVLD